MREDYGLVLGGGGSRGAYQIGVWKALIEYGIDSKITGVSGASVGALNAMLMGLYDYELAEQIWSEIEPSQFLELNEFDEIYQGYPGIGFFSREGLIEIIDEKINLEKVKNSSRTLYANASRIVERHLIINNLKAEYFKLNGRREQQIKEIVLASSAVPAVYPPEEVEGNWYQDGGLTDNIPVKPLLLEGYRNIIIINCFSINLNGLKLLYPEANLFILEPSKDLGGVITGSFDFTAEGARRRWQIGYEDGLRELIKLVK